MTKLRLAFLGFRHGHAYTLYRDAASCPDVPAEVMDPRESWADKAAYDAKAKHLSELFRNNFKQFEEGVSEAVRNAGPKG